ncbi:hypothetical protein RF11_06644 [Thelohanellus kitauei]|uniref:Uncharacterized protein n=1 Tax=Thelohanellus kitauei TaxID=669202 RepID=A0A0C2MSS6_THEKT|nr:hypothetical protein RF11_06644 [Thelohanellus kitauei]
MLKKLSLEATLTNIINIPNWMLAINFLEILIFFLYHLKIDTKSFRISFVSKWTSEIGEYNMVSQVENVVNISVDKGIADIVVLGKQDDLPTVLKDASSPNLGHSND